MLEVKNLSFGYIKQPLCLKDVSFKVDSGEIALILGGEGMGKTSLLRVLCGLEKQYFGQILINGRDAREMSLEEQNISYLPSEPVLLENKSLLENIKYLFKVQNKECLNEEKLLKVFEEFEFNFDLKTKVKKLSSCNKKIFSIIRSYIKNSEIVLIDDLFFNENEENIELIKNAIYRLKSLKNSDFSLICVAKSRKSLINANKYFYLSFLKLNEIDSIDSLKHNPIDLHAIHFFNHYSKLLEIEKHQGNYFLIETTYEKINKKNMVKKEVRRIKLNQELNASLDKEKFQEGSCSYQVILSSFNQFNIDDVSDEQINKLLINKDVFLFVVLTWSVIEF